MKTVALIPIKLGSKRVPGKNIKPFFDGTPLMHFIQKACMNAKTIDEVYVYCSDQAVTDYVLPGVHYLKRPEYLDGDNINANDFIKEFMNTVDADIYVNAHATAPFAKSETVDDCVLHVASGEYDSAFCAEVLRTFMWENGNPINFNPNHFPRTQDLPTIYGEAAVAYVFTKDTFTKYSRRVGVKPYIKVVDKFEAMDIDYPEDFDICNAIYENMVCKNASKNRGGIITE